MMTREEAIEVLENGGWWDSLIPVTTIEGRIEDDKLHEALDLAIAALRPVSRERVERMRGEWKHYLPPLGAGDVQCRCTRCGRTPDVETPFCAWCGAPMTDEAVEMVMERLEALKDDSTTD